MREFFLELLESLLGGPFEDAIAERLEGCFGNIGAKLFLVFMLVFWYSGFADYENFGSRGYRIFFLPIFGVIAALILYATAFCHPTWLDSAVGAVLSIGAPFAIPFVFMFWFRERDAIETINLIVILASLLVGLMLLAVLVDPPNERRVWLSLLLLVLIMATAWIAMRRVNTGRPHDRAVPHNYEPLRAFARGPG